MNKIQASTFKRRDIVRALPAAALLGLAPPA